jgi:hypothetical protein
MGSIGYMSCFYNKICKYSTSFLSQSKPQSEKEVKKRTIGNKDTH